MHTIIKLIEHPELLSKASAWFHEKWHYPIEAYQTSMLESFQSPNTIPQWYLIVNEHQQIQAGAGLIENDFHNRKDLTPNVCALYVEEAFRKQRLAKCLLSFIEEDAKNMGIFQLYLISDHTTFYEQYGWTHRTFVQDDDGSISRMYTKHIISG